MDERRNNDCYYFVFSTCEKGDECPYRHCAEALGNKPVCKYWLRHDCTRKNCPFRHLETKRDRASMQCYYENQKSGCTKVFCVYQHRKPRVNLMDAIRQNDISVILPVKNLRSGRRMSTESEPAMMRDEAGTSSSSSYYDSDNEEEVLKQASVELEIQEYAKEQISKRESSSSKEGILDRTRLLGPPVVYQNARFTTSSQPGHVQARTKPNSQALLPTGSGMRTQHPSQHIILPLPLPPTPIPSAIMPLLPVFPAPLQVRVQPNSQPIVPTSFGRKYQHPSQGINQPCTQLPPSARPSNGQLPNQKVNLQKKRPVQPLPVSNENHLVSSNNETKKKERRSRSGKQRVLDNTPATIEDTDAIEVHANLPSKVDHHERNGLPVLQVTKSKADNMLNQTEYSLTGVKEIKPSMAYEENVKALSRHFNRKCKIPSGKQKQQRRGLSEGPRGRQTEKTP